MSSKPDTAKKRLLTAFAFFVILPATYQLIVDQVGRDTKATPIPISSPTQSSIDTAKPSKPSCIQIRGEAEDAKLATDNARNVKLNELYFKQKTVLLKRLQALHENKQMTEDQWRSISYLVEFSTSDGPPISQFVEEFIKGEEIFKSLIKRNLLEPYFDKEVIKLGNELAKSVNPEWLITTNNPECFEKYEVDAAESFLNIKVKPAWENKKEAAEFVEVLIYRAK